MTKQLELVRRWLPQRDDKTAWIGSTWLFQRADEQVRAGSAFTVPESRILTKRIELLQHWLFQRADEKVLAGSALIVAE